MPDAPDRKPLPCIVCGKTLEAIFPPSEKDEGDYVQPAGANSLSGSGTFGSRIFDPLDGSYVEANVCDECLAVALAEGRAAVYRADVTTRVSRAPMRVMEIDEQELARMARGLEGTESD